MYNEWVWMEANGHHIKTGFSRHKGQQLFPLSLSPISTIQVMGGSLEKKGPIIIDNQSSTQKLTLSQRATVVCQAVEKFNPGSWKYFWVFHSIFLWIVFKSLLSCCFRLMPRISCRSERSLCQHLDCRLCLVVVRVCFFLLLLKSVLSCCCESHL